MILRKGFCLINWHHFPRSRWLITFLPLFFLFSSVPAQTLAGRIIAEPVIRIGIKVRVDQSTVSCDGRMRIWRRDSGLTGSVFRSGTTLTFSPARIDGKQYGTTVISNRDGFLGTFHEELICEPISPGESLKVDGKAYRGEMVIRVMGPDEVTVINVLHIEDYLKGVLPMELGSSPKLATSVLKAQAIAARSYTLYYLGRRESEGFDLYASPLDQVYGGVEVETARASQAVMSTRGGVALYKGKPIRANYSSTCGGVTEASGSTWPGESFPYLRPIKDRAGRDILCEGSYRFRWTEKWTRRQFFDTILKYLPEEVPEARKKRPTRVVDIKVTRRSASKRAEVLLVKTDVGDFKVLGDRIRWVLRPTSGRPLWSTLFGTLKRSGNEITLKGGGYGHGVGLCQIGAMELGRRGRSAPQILRHYYRNITLEKWW